MTARRLIRFISAWSNELVSMTPQWSENEPPEVSSLRSSSWLSINFAFFPLVLLSLPTRNFTKHPPTDVDSIILASDLFELNSAQQCVSLSRQSLSSICHRAAATDFCEISSRRLSIGLSPFTKRFHAVRQVAEGA
jgi:hypothetical protein